MNTLEAKQKKKKKEKAKQVKPEIAEKNNIKINLKVKSRCRRNAQLEWKQINEYAHGIKLQNTLTL